MGTKKVIANGFVCDEDGRVATVASVAKEAVNGGAQTTLIHKVGVKT